MEKTLRAFNGENAAEIRYTRPEVKVRFHLYGTREDLVYGIAAILMCGLLCREEQWDSSQQTREA